METKMKQHRESRGEPLAAVARATGIHRTTLYRLEAGEATPSQANARKLFDYYAGAVPLAHIYDPAYATVADQGRKKAPSSVVRVAV